LSVRLSGAKPAVEAAMAKVGGRIVDQAEAAGFWTGVREQESPYFADTKPLWRLSVKSTTPPLDLPRQQPLEWGGAPRWLKSDAGAATVRAAACAAGGHATLFRGGDKSTGVFQPLSGGLMKIHQRLKHTFDPAGILNPGRLYPDL